MLIGGAGPLAEEWRRDTKTTMVAEGDHAPGHWHQERLQDKSYIP